MRPKSITGPLVLVVVGVVFLLNNLGHDIPLWSYIVDYWPFLLIGMGVIGLAEALLHVSRGSTLPPRPMSGGGIFWVLVLCALLALWTAGHNGFQFGRLNTSGGISMLGSNFDYGVSASSPAQGVSRFVLDSIDGNLTVRGDDTGNVNVTGHKSVRSFSRNGADRANQGSAVRLERQGDSLVLHIGEPAHSGMLSISADLDIVVPKGMDVEVRGRNGDLTIQDIAGGVSVSNTHGDVRLNNIGKDVRVEGARGGLLRAADVKGLVDLQGRGGDVQLENVAGPVSINGEFSGTLEFRAIAKELHLESSRSDFRVEQIPGSVTMDLGNMKLDNVTGPVRFRTGSRDIEANDVTDALELNVDRGDIDIESSKLPLPKMDVHSRNGDITLTLPEKANFDLEGRTGAGEVDNSFGSPLVNRSNGRSATIDGKVGNGPSLVVVTDRGTLSIKKK